MNLNLYSTISESYKSPSQKIRVLSENWVGENIYCPNCGNSIKAYENNRPVADFYCAKCNEDFELKSKKGSIGNKIVDGAYSTMIDRLNSNTNPHFFFLTYNQEDLRISNFLVIPKYFFIPAIIEKRKPLSPNAKRAGWVGCNILLKTIPKTGKIYFIKDRRIRNKNIIIDEWNKTSFLKFSPNIKAKGWLLDLIQCIERIDRKDFSLSDIYQFEDFLKIKHPANKNIKAKIRQQLQVLRDENFLELLGQGRYRLK